MQAIHLASGIRRSQLAFSAPAGIFSMQTSRTCHKRPGAVINVDTEIKKRILDSRGAIMAICFLSRHSPLSYSPGYSLAGDALRHWIEARGYEQGSGKYPLHVNWRPAPQPFTSKQQHECIPSTCDFEGHATHTQKMCSAHTSQRMCDQLVIRNSAS